MIQFKKYVYKAGIPLTIEAPTFRSKSRLDEFISLFKKYDFKEYFGGVNITNFPMGNPTPDSILIGYIIKSVLDIDVIPHISASLESRYTLLRSILNMSICDIRNILLIGGDIKTKYGMKIDDAMHIINNALSGSIYLDDRKWDINNFDIFVGGALIPNRKDEAERTLYKIKIGFRFFQTQLIFDHNRIINVLRKLNNKLINSIGNPIPILIGITPYLIDKIIGFLDEGHFGYVPNEIYRYSRNEFIEFISSLLREIIDISKNFNNVKIGIHFMPVKWREDSFKLITKMLEKIL